MKVTVKHIDSGLSSEDKKMYNDFIKFINSKYPVGNPLTILFLGKKSGAMSTGSQNMNGEIRVLSRNRLNRDIMRTLAHVWVHAHQRLVLGRERGPDIGGQNEDEANAFAGRLIKMFEADYPHYNGLVFESTTKLMKNVQLLNEQILLTEKEEIRNDLLLEMKKIGIEKLPYSYSAMKQFVDPETMDIHYNKHYKGYVKKLNDALSKKNYKDLELEDIIKSISKFDEKVRNNAGGAFNHALFWKMLSPKKQRPSGEVYEKIKKQYGNIKNLKDEFNQVALDRFGSGWAWLILTKNNKLKIMSTPNQDNPLMNIIKDGGYPLLGLDVWEHAYYLRYRNKRDEYIKNFWNHINWEFVNDLYLNKTKKTLNEGDVPLYGIWANRGLRRIPDDYGKSIEPVDTEPRYIGDEPRDPFYEKYPQPSFYSEKGRYARKMIQSRPDLPSLRKLCPKGGYGENPYCRLNHMSRFLDDDIRVDLETTIEVLNDYFRIKKVGLYPKIVELALEDDGRTVSYLKLLADFIQDEDYDKSKTKQILNKQRNSNTIPNNLEELLSQVRMLEHQKYEQRFLGDYFDKKSTFLKLDYRCDDDAKDTLFKLLTKIGSEEKTIDMVYEQMIRCIQKSLNSGTYYLKADIVSKKDLKYEDEIIFKSGTYFEVKKMDPFIDSYLSEFFSIFKETKIGKFKDKYLEIYNELIDRVFNWLISNPTATEYLNKIKSQIGGIIYEYDTIVPIEYIDLYWSDKGQRDCNEKRLSIRFKIKKGVNEIKTFKFKNSEELTPILKKVLGPEKEKVDCK